MSTSNTDGSGLFVVTRNTSNLEEMYRNGTQVYDFTRAPCAALPSGNYVHILNRNSDVDTDLPSTRQVSMAFMGSELTQAEVTTLTNAFETYMDSNGSGYGEYCNFTKASS